MKSQMFEASKRGTAGRKLCRNLRDDCVARAVMKNLEPGHLLKFMGRSEREMHFLKLAIARR